MKILAAVLAAAAMCNLSAGGALSLEGGFRSPPDSVKTASGQRQGRIDLEVKVTNLWPNRLIGDDVLYPEDCKWEMRWHGWQKLNEPGIKEIPQWVKDGWTSPTGRHTFTTWKHWTKTDSLLPSGLLGPVSFVTSSAHDSVAR